MRTLLLILFIFSQTAWGENQCAITPLEVPGGKPPPKGPSILDTMAKEFKDQYIKAALQRGAEEAVSYTAGEAAAKTLGQAVSYGMGAWSISKDVKAYGAEGSSETQKFYAASNTAATIIGFVPGWGQLVSFLMVVNNMTMQAVGSWYSKKMHKDVLQVQLEIWALLDEMSNYEECIARGEMLAAGKYFAENQTAAKFIEDSMPTFQKTCRSPEATFQIHWDRPLKESYGELDRCVEQAENLLAMINVYVWTYQQILKVPNWQHAIKAELEKQKKPYDVFLKEMKSVQDQITAQREEFRSAVKTFREQKSALIKSMIQKSPQMNSLRLEARCRELLSHSGRDILATAHDTSSLRNYALSAKLDAYDEIRAQQCDQFDFSSTGGLARLHGQINKVKAQVLSLPDQELLP